MRRPGGFHVWKAGDQRLPAPRESFRSGRYQGLVYDKGAWGTMVHKGSAGSTLSQERRRPSEEEIAERLRTGRPLGQIEIEKLLDTGRGEANEAEELEEETVSDAPAQACK